MLKTETECLDTSSESLTLLYTKIIAFVISDTSTPQDQSDTFKTLQIVALIH